MMSPASEALKRARAKARRERFEVMFLQHCRLERLPEPKPQYRFHATRQWRLDFAWPEYGVAVEVSGGVFTNGRHTRGKGFEEDCIKYAEAALAGFTLLQFSTTQVEKGLAIKFTKALLGARMAAANQ